MKYKSVVMTRRGGPNVLKVIENNKRQPEAGEVLVKIQATGVGRTDVAMRYGYYPFAPKIPFTPGYEIIGKDLLPEYIFLNYHKATVISWQDYFRFN
jgi:NADPH:quinone reductase-like Zn-dependent oxidoreductase